MFNAMRQRAIQKRQVAVEQAHKYLENAMKRTFGIGADAGVRLEYPPKDYISIILDSDGYRMGYYLNAKGEVIHSTFLGLRPVEAMAKGAPVRVVKVLNYLKTEKGRSQIIKYMQETELLRRGK